MEEIKYKHPTGKSDHILLELEHRVGRLKLEHRAGRLIYSKTDFNI